MNCDDTQRVDKLVAPSSSSLRMTREAGEKPRSSISIQNVQPEVDCGRYPVKRSVGERINIRADIVRPGHDLLFATLNYRIQDSKSIWKSEKMIYFFNEDVWSAGFPLERLGVYEYFIEAWMDTFGTNVEKFRKWIGSSEKEALLMRDAIIGQVKEAVSESSSWERPVLEQKLTLLESSKTTQDMMDVLSDEKFANAVVKNSPKLDYISSQTYEVTVDRREATFSTWYEMFPRSQGRIPGTSGTFRDSMLRLRELSDMGFNVIYLPPVHPIGKTNRRGPNNTPGSGSDPGSPWAIGNDQGGYYSINPDLGTVEDFQELVTEAQKSGMEIALDLAFQVSPDHPYVKEHPEWFDLQSDGTIRYAENPPKKYFDVYPFFFEGPGWKELWQELLNVVLFWIGKGVRIFRVDNPHTKPLAFWEWLIAKVRKDHPDVIFLAEAFTRPKAMRALAKAGFNQSYTYFTWKNTKYELTEFIQDFIESDTKEYYRGNLFVNTPDILHEFLQSGGKPAFLIRLILAATLSSCYGIYSGFELLERIPREKGSEEYLDSEKYQIKVRNWDEPGNIKQEISKINAIRKANPALQEYRNLHLLKSDTDQLLFYGKWTEDRSNVILVVVNLDPFAIHEGKVKVPLSDLGLGQSESYRVIELLTDNVFTWQGEWNYVRLDPNLNPAHVLKLIDSKPVRSGHPT